MYINVIFVLQLLSCVGLFVTPWTTACRAPLSATISWNLLKFMSIELVMLSNHLMPSPSPLPFIFPSIRVFPSESALLIRWPKHWNFSISPSNEYSGLISFRIYWFDLLAIQGTLKEFSPAPQFKGFNSSVLSLLYGPTLTSIHDCWKNHSFDYSILVCCLFVLAILPRRKHLFISWLQSPWVKVAQLCLTLCDPMDYTVHGIFQARILQWVDFPFSSG